MDGWVDRWMDGTCVLLLPSLGLSNLIWCGGESVAMRRACAPVITTEVLLHFSLLLYHHTFKIEG